MTNLLDTDLTAKTAVELRKIGSAAGIKGAAKGKKADLLAALLPIQDAQRAERDAEIAAKAKAKPAKRSTKCTECGRPEDFVGSNLCEADREYAEWENAHSDQGHEALADSMDLNEVEYAKSCPVCHPELDPRKARSMGRSRAGMVIIAKGTEVHKSLTFKRAAEALGWTVEISTEEYEDGDETNTRHFADATRGEEAIQLAWDGRAYDYHASSAVLKGKSRKVRNLKEALRLI